MESEKSLWREDMLWLTNHQAGAASETRSAGPATRVMVQLKSFLDRMVLSRKGKNANAAAPDPAVAIIMQISDPEVRQMVKELHYLTPASLKTMRNACAECFFLPEDCPYVDYSIPDVNKAIRRMSSHPSLSSSPAGVIEELAKINRELAFHLREHFEAIGEEAQA